jgi:hypothetical protein
VKSGRRRGEGCHALSDREKDGGMESTEVAGMLEEED